MLYVKQDYSAMDTATAVNVTEANVEQWVEEYRWEDARLSLSISIKRQLHLMYTIVDKLNSKAGKNIDDINAKD